MATSNKHNANEEKGVLGNDNFQFPPIPGFTRMYSRCPLLQNWTNPSTEQARLSAGDRCTRDTVACEEKGKNLRVPSPYEQRIEGSTRVKKTWPG